MKIKSAIKINLIPRDGDIKNKKNTCFTINKRINVVKKTKLFRTQISQKQFQNK